MAASPPELGLSFPFGCQYYRAPTPLSGEWEEDLERIRRMGLNVVQLRAQWRWHERLEGYLMWSDLDRLFDLCERQGLRVVVKFQLETAPDWVFREQDGYRMNAAGQRLLPVALGSNYVGGWMPCFDRPIVREAARGFVASAVERYRQRKALLAWNVWNEPRRRGFDVCSCPDSLEAYRAWLAKRFGPIDRFNARFAKAFGSYEDVGGPTGVRDYVEAWLFRLWAMHAVANQVRWAADLVRRSDGDHPIMSHVGICLPLQDVLEDSSDDHLNCRGVDIYGSSFPMWTGDFHGYADIEGQATFGADPTGGEFYIYPLIGDWIRSVKPGFWINEIYGNTWWIDAPDFEPEDLSIMTWSAVATGAKGLLYWQYRSERLGEESVGCGLVGVDGAPTPRSERVAAMASVIKANVPTFRDWEPAPARVALLYDVRSDLVSRLETAAGNFGGGRDTVRYRYKEVLKGLYALLWRANIAVDFVDTRHLDRLENYALVLAGAVTVMDRPRAEALTRYVQGGGTLVVEPGFASRDARTWMCPDRPGSGLKALTATAERAVKRIEPGRTLGFEDLELPVAGVASQLETDIRGPLAQWSDGSPAVVERALETGRIIWLGVHPALCFADGHDSGWVEFTRRLAARADVQPAVATTARAWVRLGSVRGKQAAWCFNYEADGTIILLPGFGRRSTDLVGGAEIQGTADGAHVQVPPRAVAFVVDPGQLNVD